MIMIMRRRHGGRPRTGHRPEGFDPDRDRPRIYIYIYMASDVGVAVASLCRVTLPEALFIKYNHSSVLFVTIMIMVI